MSFLDLKNVTKIYPNGTKAVHETSLSIDEGVYGFCRAQWMWKINFAKNGCGFRGHNRR